ncbi:hypothetical protein [Agrobacterium genomosp. 2]|uniref:Uncharacterized protein n=1 Tax=Agrobacterium genomosp. 2 str. CFBP 5494 TaxID=1183436 RepID=A0A9W5AZ10_9HYPH|nr:hypothetical protein [Agrobacterium genomosp. 2]CUW87575.1 hypothetical protein AGR2A_Cc120104 [Agrobacterium genomosp. 2 str. CFBP 5494]
MTKLDDDRRMRLRGSYLDRIVEVAQFYIATHSYFIESDFKSFIADEFTYLTELSDEERQYLRDQVGLESLRRVAISRAKDQEEFFRKLVADNPDIVVHYANLAFDLGWLDLLKDAVARMRTYPAAWKVRLDGATERFGCLVLHVSFMVAERGATAEIKRMREEIRLRSLATCEVCGENGRLRLGAWAKTVCDKHSAIFDDFQEDDGHWADPWRWLEKKQSSEGRIADEESADVQAGLDELDRGESVHINEVLDKARAIVADAEHRKRQSAISRQIETDLEKNGRKAELLLEFRGQIETAVVAAMSVADDDVGFWLHTEVGRWRGVQPSSEDDRDFLLRYVRSLAIDERGRRMPSSDLKSDND